MSTFEFGMWASRPAGRRLRGGRAAAAALAVAMAMLLAPAGASATSPVLEFVVPGHQFPVGFTTESGPVTAQMAGFGSLVHCQESRGKGEITGPRSTLSEYTLTGCETEGGSHVKCDSEKANEGEIRTGPIEAELVYIDQAKHEVGMLLDPAGGPYIVFKCGGESAEGFGPFLAPIGPLNEEATVFTATLDQSESMQMPDEYEGGAGERIKAIPMAVRNGEVVATTGVEAAFTVHSSVPGYVRAVSTEELVAKQHEEEAATKKRQEEEAATAAAEKKRLEEAAVATGNPAKLEEEAAAQKRLQAEMLTALRDAISRTLAPSGARARIGALLEHGGLTQTFAAPEPGALVIRWWWTPPGAHSRRHKRTPVLVAQASAMFSIAGARKVEVGLTSAGRRLLASAKELTLSANVQFTPTAHPPIAATRLVSLKRR
jgi:hypothetical protein